MLFASSHASEKALRRYEYWRAQEPGKYYCLLAFDDFLGFMAHQASEHHEAAVPALMGTIADMRLEWIDPVTGAAPLPPTLPQAVPNGASDLIKRYAAMMPVAVADWWLALRSDQPVEKRPMNTELAQRNRELVQRLFEQVINAHCLAPIEQFYRHDYIQHNANVAPGVTGLRQLLGMLFEAFPDLHGNISLSVAEDDRVMVLVEWRGTHLGAFAGLPPFGKIVRFRSAEIFRIEGGLLAEHWDVVDNVEFLLALGLLATPDAREQR